MPNPVCGSVLIEYDQNRLTPEAIWQPLAQLGLVPTAMPSGERDCEPSPDEFWRRIATNIGADLLSRTIAACII